MKTLSDYKLVTTELTHKYTQYLRDEPVWRAELNSGVTVFRKEEPGEENSWFRLKRYLGDNAEDYIKNLSFSFRDHFEQVGIDRRGFVFFHMVGCWYGNQTQFYWKGGYLLDNENKVLLREFSIPELLINKEEVRNIDGIIEDALILRK